MRGMDVVELAAVARFSAEKLQKVSILDSPRMFFDLYCMEPGQAQKPHRHAGSDKVYVVLEGRARFAVDGEERDVEAGHAVVCPAGSDHGVSNPGPLRAKLLVAMAGAAAGGPQGADSGRPRHAAG
jgi:mannose-6-phosphate isomerase-like protein (cupin superfamily)